MELAGCRARVRNDALERVGDEETVERAGLLDGWAVGARGAGTRRPADAFERSKKINIKELIFFDVRRPRAWLTFGRAVPPRTVRWGRASTSWRCCHELFDRFRSDRTEKIE